MTTMNIPFTNVQNVAQTQNFAGRFVQPMNSDDREYDCNQCAMKVHGAGTLALHVALRHGRQFYQDWVNKTFQALQMGIQEQRGEELKFECQCPVDGCTQPVGADQQLQDFHLMYSHARDMDSQPYVDAYGRQRTLWEQAYRDVRGWTQQDNARNTTAVAMAPPF